MQKDVRPEAHSGEPASSPLAGALSLPDIATLDDPYLLQQARAVHRVFALLHPDTQIRCVLKAVGGVHGTPDATIFHRKAFDPNLSPLDAPEPWEAEDHRQDPRYLGTYEPGLTPDKVARALVVANVPTKPGLDADIRTSPAFQSAKANWAVRTLPVLFEQAKYHYEKRQLRERGQKHSTVPVPRENWHSGPGTSDQRDLTRKPSLIIGFHWLEVGGAEKLAFDCVKWARAVGLRVLILAEMPEAQRLAVKLPDDPDIEFIRADAYLPRPLWGDLIMALIRSENVRAIHIHHCTRLYDNLMRVKEHYPDLTIIDSTHIIEYSNGGFPRTSGVWTNYIDFHHVISRELSSFYLDTFGVSEKVILGRMIDPAKTTGMAADPTFNLNTGQKSVRLAFVGRMVHQKRAPLAIAIARKLNRWAKRNGVSIHLDMVGTGAYHDIVKQMVRRSGLGSIVTMHPPSANVPEILGRADILLLPSSNEGLALVCYEAIENGAIPLSTDVGGQDELIPDALMMRTAPIQAIRTATARVIGLLTDPDLLKRNTAELAGLYRQLRRDPKAQDVLTALYRKVLERSGN